MKEDRIYLRGVSTKGWSRGQQVQYVNNLAVGEVLIWVNHERERDDLVRVITSTDAVKWPDVVRVEYIFPDGTPVAPGHNHHITQGDLRPTMHHLYRAEQVKG